MNKTFYGKFNHRKLEERSNLAIEFPVKDNRVLRAYIPFLENPTITEKGSSNLQEYNLLGRAGSLFSYTGSKSRNFNVSFNISLQHLACHQSLEGLAEKFLSSFRLFFSDNQRARNSFNLNKFAVRQMRQGGLESQTNINHAQVHRNYYRSLISIILGEEDETTEYFLASVLPSVKTATIPLPDNKFKRINDTINLVYVWLNLIRGTTLNNSRNTLFGPPIVRLNHGPMYNNVPCVVDSYEVRIVEEAGYDIQTLTPNRITINLSLKETRTGDYNRFRPGKIESGDTLAGWEAVYNNNTIDPYNGSVEPYLPLNTGISEKFLDRVSR